MKKKGLIIIATIVIIAIIVGVVLLVSNNKGSESANDENKIVVGSKEVSNDANTYYGQLVENYNVEGMNSWRIFYADEDNIYLIADDYISGKDAAKSANYSLESNNTEYSVAFSHIYQDYKGVTDIDSEFANKWLSKYQLNSPKSENINIKATAYLLDKNIWKKFANNYADYAIGAPTIEMFCASYKDTHKDRYVEYVTDEKESGYKVKWNDKEDYEIIDITDLGEDEYNSIYVKSDHSKAYGMWLASPSIGTVKLRYINYAGMLAEEHFLRNNIGLRPIVCLKSSVQLESQANGNYRIKG